MTGKNGMARGMRGGRQGLLRRVGLIGLVVPFLGGCEAFTNSNLMDFFKGPPRKVDSTPQSELGLGKLAKGQLLAAQARFDAALRLDPRDVHALLGKGMVFQQTGQVTAARNAYEAVLALRPDDGKKMLVLSNLKPRLVREIASVNLSLLQSRGVRDRFGGKPAVQQPPAGAPQSKFTPPPARRAPVARRAGVLSAGDNNAISRFKILRGLRDQGLITPDEYSLRRRANLGALLRHTTPPPASGLDRPVPSAAQITGRLRAIGRALELRAISVRQHGAERTMIVDGLMPARPVARAKPAAPPKGLMEAADAVGRLEGLREAGLISPEEYAKERAAIEKFLQPGPAAPKGQPKTATKAEEKAAMGPRPGIHIASFRSAQAANRGWAQLRRAHRALLGKLKPEVSRVNLGPGKGTFFRLLVGPLKSQAEATRLCRQLKRRRQYCEPAFVGTG
jgi:tetratricopeptide (TPR) repeat protein